MHDADVDLLPPLAVTVVAARASPARASFAARVAVPALKAGATAWFVVVLVGHALFALYLVVAYWLPALVGDIGAWDKVLPKAIVAGNPAANVATAVHVLVAAILMIGGGLQLVPALRRRAPRFHRWNGRVFLATVVVMSLGGGAMLFLRQPDGDLWQRSGLLVNVALNLAFATLLLHHARARRIAEHRRWALRLFLAVNGGWFFRIMLMLWIVANQGPVGFDPETFRGPFLSMLSFAQYLLPLAVLELYFRAEGSTKPAAKLAMAAGLGVATLATAAAIAAAAMILWLPHLLPAP